MGAAVMTPADRLEIHELVNLYGHIVDDRQWGRVVELFTDDALFDASGADGIVVTGWRAIAEHWADPATRHPLAHHATNIVIGARDGESVAVTFKGLGVGYRGRVGSLVYRAAVVPGPDGWRFARLSAYLRRPPHDEGASP
jgi:hypothetical protein